MITVDEIMTAKPFTLTDSDTVGGARKLMSDRDIRHIPILNSDGELVGLVTHRDVLAATASSLADSATTDDVDAVPLSRIMVEEVETVSPGSSLKQAALRLKGHKYGCLPVVDEDKIIGIITDSDFVGVAINLLEQKEEMDLEDFEELDIDDDELDNLEFEVPESDDWDTSDI